MASSSGRVPMLDESGRFPDRFAPPSVGADAAAASQAKLDAQQARTDAQAAAGTVPAQAAEAVATEVVAQVDPKVTAAAGSAVSAASSATQANTSKTEAVQAAAAAQAVGATNDGIMAGVAADPSSDFGGVLKATIGESAVKRGEPFFMVTDFGAKGDGTSDDTAAFQAAVDAAQAVNSGAISGGGVTVVIPHSNSNYRVNQVTIRNGNASYISLVGWGNSIIQPIGAEDGRPVFIIGGTDSTNSNRSIRLQDIRVYGTGYWNHSTQVNRLAFQIPRAGFMKWDNVIITGFKAGAIDGYDLWDNQFHSLRILTCGHSTSDSEYAYAVNLAGTQDHSNANEFVGLHIEHCPLVIRFLSGSRWNHFMGGKIEFSARLPDTSTRTAISFEDSFESTFQGTMFTENRVAVKPMMRSEGSDSGMVTTNNVRRRHIFIGCQFYGGIVGGGKIIPAYGSDFDFTSCVFNRLNGDSMAAFTLSYRNKVSNCTFTFADVGIRLLNFIGNNNSVEGSTVERPVSAASSNGAYITLGAAVTDNVVRGFRRLGPQAGISLISTSQTDLGDNVIIDMVATTKVVTTGALPSVLLMYMLALNYGTATTITDFIQGHRNQRIVVRPSNANITLAHSADMQLKGGADRNLASGEVVELINDAGVWREL